jgi:hypothetical protein
MLRGKNSIIISMEYSELWRREIGVVAMEGLEPGVMATFATKC